MKRLLIKVLESEKNRLIAAKIFNFAANHY